MCHSSLRYQDIPTSFRTTVAQRLPFQKAQTVDVEVLLVAPEGSVNFQYKYSVRRMSRNTSTVRPTQSSWFGTPSAAGSSMEDLPLLNDFLMGAGVTGRLGRSASVGKSVILVPGRAGPAITWMLPFRDLWSASTYLLISGTSSHTLDRGYDRHKS